MQAGKLDRRVTLLARFVEKNGFGEEIETWAEGATVWAQYLPVKGQELQRGDDAQQQAVMEAIFRIRWRSDVNAATRIRFDGADWNIKSIAELGRRDGLELQAIASVA